MFKKILVPLDGSALVSNHFTPSRGSRKKPEVRDHLADGE